MPKKLLNKVKKELQENNGIKNYKQLVINLAEKFNVSYIAMEYRLRALNKYE